MITQSRAKAAFVAVLILLPLAFARRLAVIVHWVCPDFRRAWR